MQIWELQDKLGHLNKCSADKLGLFGGEHAQRLQRAIKKHVRNFHHKPVGPIGHYLALSDDRCVYYTCMQMANFYVWNRFPDNLLLLSVVSEFASSTCLHAYTACTFCGKVLQQLLLFTVCIKPVCAAGGI